MIGKSQFSRWTRVSLAKYWQQGLGVIVLALLWSGGPFVAACGDNAESELPKTQLRFELEASTEESNFFAFPFPSDLRLAEGSPVIENYPNPSGIALLTDLASLTKMRKGFATTSASYFQFDAAMPALPMQDFSQEEGAQVFMLNISESSPGFGSRVPLRGRMLAPDSYAPDNVLAVGPRPGIVLEPSTRYAVVVTTEFVDGEGRILGTPQELLDLLAGSKRGNDGGYAELGDVLVSRNMLLENVAAANVFTTGDVVAESASLGDKVLEAFSLELTGLAMDLDDGDHETFCELHARVDFPQFQEGNPPFSSKGRFKLDASGTPIVQRQEESGIALTLPKGEMPKEGYPLAMYFHGSGGLFEQVVDRGRVFPGQSVPTKGEGPAFVVAKEGFAAVGSAHPVNPERLPGASAIEYINLSNLAAYPYTFTQGIVEQRLLLDALLELRISVAQTTGCSGLSLPDGQSEFFFDPDSVVAMGQSMGGMYANLIGATEPRIKAIGAFGAGGLWHSYILQTTVVTGARDLLSVVLRTSSEELSHLHPALQLLAQAWEPAEPMVFMPRVGKNPLPGHPARSIYQPVGEGDSYFPIGVYDAAALAYQHPQIGVSVWSGMQEALALIGLDGLLPYPIAGNLVSKNGENYTGAVVQYEGDGYYDPHSIFAQLDAVKFQYRCFFKSAIAAEVAELVAPGAVDDSCP